MQLIYEIYMKRLSQPIRKEDEMKIDTTESTIHEALEETDILVNNLRQSLSQLWSELSPVSYDHPTDGIPDDKSQSVQSAKVLLRIQLVNESLREFIMNTDGMRQNLSI